MKDARVQSGGALIGEKDMCGNTSKELEVCNLNIFPPLDFPASNILQHIFFEFTTNTTMPSNQIERIHFLYNHTREDVFPDSGN